MRPWTVALFAIAALIDAVRRGPQLELPIDQRDGRRVAASPDDVPGEVAAQHEDLTLLAADGLHAAAARRVFALQAHELVPQRGGLVA